MLRVEKTFHKFAVPFSRGRHAENTLQIAENTADTGVGR